MSTSKKLPKISIVTPSFNQAKYLESCIYSVLSQSYTEFEYIIIDGGSTDGSVEIIKKYAKYLAYWQSAPDDGQYAAISNGLARTDGEIITWLNSDDILHPNCFNVVGSLFASREEIDWIMGRPNGYDEVLKLPWVHDELPRWSREKYLNKQYKEPYIQQEGTFWRRRLWDKAGATIRTDLKYAADLELWVRFFRYAQLYTVDCQLAGFRAHPDQKTQVALSAYHEEAELVLDQEIRFFEKSSDKTLLPSPEPVLV